MLKAVEEFAAECSIVKVYASEMLDYVVDEGVQIHGGYGFHQDYAVERAYRDSRINRIFEGTNEINRLLIPGMLLKRAARGQLGLLAAAKSALQDDATAAPPSDEESRLVENAKKIALLNIAAAHRKYPHRPREATGSPDAHRGHDHRDVRDGVGAVALAQAGGGRAKQPSRPI